MTLPNSFKAPWDANLPPTFVNEEGVKWWPDASSTRYAHTADGHGTTLEEASVWYVEKPNGYRTRVIIVDGEIDSDNTSIEGVGARIDILKAVKRFGAAP